MWSARNGRFFSLCAALGATVACGHRPPDPAAPVASTLAVPVYEEPRHRLVFQSPEVRVMDVTVASGETTGYHVHANLLVGIAVQDARFWAQAPGAAPGPVTTLKSVPYLFDNWTQDLPYTHRIANADTQPFHYIVAEWLARSGPEAPSLPDGGGRDLVKESPTTRVYQITLAPGAVTEPHTHASPGLVVLGTAGVLSEDATPRARGGKGAGSWSWRETPGRHVLRNEGSTDIVIYELDWR